MKKKKVLVAIGVVCGALGGALVSTEAHAQQSVNAGLYRISPKLAPHKTWDLPGKCPGLNNLSAVTLYAYDSYDCNYPSVDQKWYITQAGSDSYGPYYTVYQGQNAGAQCLDLNANNAVNGGTIQTYSCNGTTAQQWYFNQTQPGNSGSLYGTWNITSRSNTGYVIDLAGCTTENGTKVQLWQRGVGVCDNGNGQQWVLTRADQDMLVQDFADDFTSINTSNWQLENDGPGAYNSELESYSPNQVTSDGHNLNITANYVSGKTPNTSGAYVSGRINSGAKQYYQNGAWSASFRYSQNDRRHKGAWPAIWLLGEGIENGINWPLNQSREIDFGEWMFVNNWVDAGEPSNEGYDGNAIYGNTGGAITDMLTNHAGNPDGYFNPNDVVVFKIVFDENVGTGGPLIRFYANGNFQASWGMDAFYNQPYYAIINLAIGGSVLFNGNADASGFTSTSDYAKIQVDWIAHEKWCSAAAMAAGSC
jgi:hypothetical protein